jgi:hypothetical protein
VTGPSTAEEKTDCGTKVECCTGPSTAVLPYAVDTPVQPRKEGLERGRVPLGETCERRVSLGVTRKLSSRLR